MEQRPPSRPRVAWEEDESSQESSSLVEPIEVCEVEPLQPDAIWLPVYEEEEEAVVFIEAYVRNPERDEVQKMKFLRNIVTVCTTAQEKGLLEGLDIFCSRNKLAQNIQVLLDEEPRDKLCTAVRQQAMLAIYALSVVEMVLEDKMMSLVAACSSSVFFLPPEEELDIHLYNMTLNNLDIMLRTLLISAPASSLWDRVNIIFQVLLQFTTSETKIVKERAMERIWKVIFFLYVFSGKQIFGNYIQPSHRKDIVRMTLEIIRESSIDNNKKHWANFMLEVAIQDPEVWLMEVPKILRFLHENLNSNSTSLPRNIFTSVLHALTGQFPRQAVISVLTDLPSLDSTTLDMWEEMISQAKISRTVLRELCAVVRSRRSRKLFRANTINSSIVHIIRVIRGRRTPEDFYESKYLQRCLRLQSLPMLSLALRALVMESERCEAVREVRVLLPEVMETLQYDNTHITEKALTVFENVIGHLEKTEASPIALALAERLLPLFNNVSSEVRVFSMLLFQDLMESVVWWKKGAMKTTVRRALIPLFFRMSDETQSVAKVQISHLAVDVGTGCADTRAVFWAWGGGQGSRQSDTLEMCVRCHLPASASPQASAVVLLACAKFLKWKQLEQLTQTQQAETCITGEYLLKQKSSRVDGYLQQSLPYLEDAQANLRQEAVKFIGLAVYHAGIQSEEKLNELIQGECGRCWGCCAQWRGGRAHAVCSHALPCSREMLQWQRDVGGHVGCS
ncbi:uncharacterized protein [Anser cygnoides]|uniref:uncharacterized protein isoform X3 n=1 Tax=Anser cygnoides TaxID=8845 RepID=UPI0034D26053